MVNKNILIYKKFKKKKPDVNNLEIIECQSNSVNFQKLFEKYYNSINFTNKDTENLVLIWNLEQNKTLYNYRINQNLPILVIERGPLPNTIYIDHVSIFKSNINKINHKINKNIDNLLSIFKIRSNTLEKQYNDQFDLNVTDFSEVIFIPLQRSRDTSIVYYSDWIKSKKKLL